jgi:basic membrane protein A
VDADQSKSLPEYADVILASMVKHVDEAVFRSIRRVTNGNFEGGAVNELGLEKNGVEAVYSEALESQIPQSVKSALQQSEQKIVNGEISVPTEPAAVGQGTTGQ